MYLNQDRTLEHLQQVAKLNPSLHMQIVEALSNKEKHAELYRIDPELQKYMELLTEKELLTVIVHFINWWNHYFTERQYKMYASPMVYRADINHEVLVQQFLQEKWDYEHEMAYPTLSKADDLDTSYAKLHIQPVLEFENNAYPVHDTDYLVDDLQTGKMYVLTAKEHDTLLRPPLVKDIDY